MLILPDLFFDSVESVGVDSLALFPVEVDFRPDLLLLDFDHFLEIAELLTYQFFTLPENITLGFEVLLVL